MTRQRITTINYQAGNPRPRTKTVDGRLSDYTYDHRQRGVATRTWPKDGEMQLRITSYWNNRLFFTQAPNGSREYMDYSASNASELIRRVSGTGLDFPNMGAVLTATRDLNPNANFIIVDAIKDAEGNLLETIEGRGISSKYTYDSRERETTRRDAVNTTVETKTETLYDKSSNVVEVRSPRYFDLTDPEHDRMKTLFSYNGRELQSSQTLAPGAGSAQAITSQTYTIEGKVATRTDAGSNVWIEKGV